MGLRQLRLLGMCHMQTFRPDPHRIILHVAASRGALKALVGLRQLRLLGVLRLGGRLALLPARVLLGRQLAGALLQQAAVVAQLVLRTRPCLLGINSMRRAPVVQLPACSSRWLPWHS